MCVDKVVEHLVSCGDPWKVKIHLYFFPLVWLLKTERSFLHSTWQCTRATTTSVVGEQAQSIQQPGVCVEARGPVQAGDLSL